MKRAVMCLLLLCSLFLLPACGAIKPVETVLRPLAPVGEASPSPVIVESGDRTVPSPPEETEALPAVTPQPLPPADETATEADYVLNLNTRRFHLPDCKSVSDIKETNRQSYTGSREALLAQGYVPCGRCKP